MWEDGNKNKWVECRWYYGTNDITKSSRPPYRKRYVYKCCWMICRELFETDHIINNPVEAIVDKVKVVSLEEWNSLSDEEKDKQFFCEFFYSSKTTYIHPIYGSFLSFLSLIHRLLARKAIGAYSFVLCCSS